jgi:hypothetical protein
MLFAAKCTSTGTRPRRRIARPSRQRPSSSRRESPMPLSTPPAVSSKPRRPRHAEVGLAVFAKQVVHPERTGKNGRCQATHPFQRRPRIPLHANAKTTHEGACLARAARDNSGMDVSGRGDGGRRERADGREMDAAITDRRGGGRSGSTRQTAPVPSATAPRTINVIIRLRHGGLPGWQIARRVGRPRSTVSAILRRVGLGRLVMGRRRWSATSGRRPAISSTWISSRSGAFLPLGIESMGIADGAHVEQAGSISTSRSTMPRASRCRGVTRAEWRGDKRLPDARGGVVCAPQRRDSASDERQRQWVRVARVSSDLSGADARASPHATPIRREPTARPSASFKRCNGVGVRRPYRTSGRRTAARRLG